MINSPTVEKQLITVCQRHRMDLLGLFLFVLQFEAGISGGTYHLYHRAGNDVTLPCDSVSDTCSNTYWLYNSHTSLTIDVVRDGIVVKSSAQAARLSLYSNCSLGIRNITADDAGFYHCRPGRNTDQDTAVYLNILTISASPSDTDPQRDGDVTLKCSVFRYPGLPVCPENSIRWVDETGTVLFDRGAMETAWSCDSVWTVKRQIGHNIRYTCQFVEENSVKIEAHYTPVTDPSPNKASIIIIIISIVVVMVVVVIVTAVFIKYRRRAKGREDAVNPSQSNDEPESDITYITVNHGNHEASPRKTVKREEAVTYSSVKIKDESDPSSFYSSIS